MAKLTKATKVSDAAFLLAEFAFAAEELLSGLSLYGVGRLNLPSRNGYTLLNNVMQNYHESRKEDGKKAQ